MVKSLMKSLEKIIVSNLNKFVRIYSERYCYNHGKALGSVFVLFFVFFFLYYSVPAPHASMYFSSAYLYMLWCLILCRPCTFIVALVVIHPYLFVHFIYMNTNAYNHWSHIIVRTAYCSHKFFHFSDFGMYFQL